MKRSVYQGLVGFFAFSCVLMMSFHVRAEEKVYTLKYSNFFPPAHGMSMVTEEWCKEVEKRTDGRVKINYLPGSTLAPANQAYEGAVRGITDISMVSQQYNAGRFPLTEVIYLPLGIKSAYQSTRMIDAWFKKFNPKEYDDTKILFLFASGPNQFSTIKPIASIKDLEGLKIRCAGESAKIVNAMGAVPVSIPLADSYEGLQRGVITGSLLALESLKGWRFGDFVRGVQVNDGLGFAAALAVVMNKKSWESLPPDVQKIIEGINEEWREKTSLTFDRLDKEGVEYGVSKGAQVFKISPEETALTVEKMKPLLDDYVKNMAKLGLPGEESLKFCMDWLKQNPNPNP